MESGGILMLHFFLCISLAFSNLGFEIDRGLRVLVFKRILA